MVVCLYVDELQEIHRGRGRGQALHQQGFSPALKSALKNNPCSSLSERDTDAILKINMHDIDNLQLQLYILDIWS
jgi:protocatechuate 3,4-dioxygenase beta subunit